MTAKPKTDPGHYFEDFTLGETLVHATPRTITEGDISLYTGLTGSRFAPQSAAPFAKTVGLAGQPVDDVLAFHMVFGTTVPDISLNAIANLGYAEGRFLKPLYAGATVTATSEVIGLKPNSNGKTGIVYVRTTGRDEIGDPVLDYVRWVMVRVGREGARLPDPVVPALRGAVAASDLVVPAGLAPGGFDKALSGSDMVWDDYEIGEKIDHVDGMTIEEAEHMIATRLYQNTAKVHFDQHAANQGRFGRRLIYGGVIISIARSLSFNGLQNAWFLAGLNGGKHVNPTFAGDTIYAWSEVLDKAALPGRDDLGALRIRTMAAKNRPCADFPTEGDDIVLDLDYWVLMPR